MIPAEITPQNPILQNQKAVEQCLRYMHEHPDKVPNHLSYLHRILAATESTSKSTTPSSESPPPTTIDTVMEALTTLDEAAVLQVVQRIFLGGDQLSRLRAHCAMQANSWHRDEKKALLGGVMLLFCACMIRVVTLFM